MRRRRLARFRDRASDRQQYTTLVAEALGITSKEKTYEPSFTDTWSLSRLLEALQGWKWIKRCNG
jgi:hypothetical protein